MELHEEVYRGTPFVASEAPARVRPFVYGERCRLVVVSWERALHIPSRNVPSHIHARPDNVPDRNRCLERVNIYPFGSFDRILPKSEFEL
jgi:hypothetical protein